MTSLDRLPREHLKMAKRGGEKFCCLYRLDKHEAVNLEDATSVTLGREEGNDLCLCESKGVSRKHAALQKLKDGTWTIIDLKSANGVYINNLKIPPSRPYGLHDRDVIEIGKDGNTSEPAPYRYQFYRKAKVIREDDSSLSACSKPENAQPKETENVDGKIRRSTRLRLRKGKENIPSSNPTCVINQRQTRSRSKNSESEENPTTLSSANSEHMKPDTNQEKSVEIVENCLTELDNESFANNPIKTVKPPKINEQILQTPPRSNAVQRLQHDLRRVSCSPSSMLQAKLARQEAALRKEMEAKQNNLEAEMLQLQRLVKEKQDGQAELLKELEEQRTQWEIQLQLKQAQVSELRSKAEQQEELEQRLQFTSELLEAKEVQEAELEAERVQALSQIDQLKIELENERSKEAELAAWMEQQRKREEELLREELNKEIEMLQLEKEKADEAQKTLVDEVQQLKLKDKDYEEKLAAERDTLHLVMAERDEEKLALEAELSLMRHAVDHVEANKKSIEKEQKELQKELQLMKNTVDQIKTTSKEEGQKARRDMLTNMEDVMETELLCAICSELFMKATSLNCSHSFCALCIEKWQEQKAECPQCRTKITSTVPSLVLDNYIDKMVEFLGDEAKQQRLRTVEERSVDQRTWNQAKEAKRRQHDERRQHQHQHRDNRNNNRQNYGQQINYNVADERYVQNYTAGQNYGGYFYYNTTHGNHGNTGTNARRFYGNADNNTWRGYQYATYNTGQNRH